MAIHPVILCGGAGTRLWPASVEAAPKQFINLIGERSSFQETILRVAGLDDVSRPIVVAGVKHQALIQAQLAAIGVEATILLEPQARDSAAAMAAAAAWIIGIDPLGIAVLVAADHHIPDVGAFHQAVQYAVGAARYDWIVTLGVEPTSPSSAYGYIMPGRALKGGPNVFQVARFVEKPDLQTAEAYIEAGYLWNSGNFIVGARRLLDEVEKYAPDLAKAAREAAEQPVPLGPGLWRLGKSFLTAPRISIDYAVMERTDRAAVVAVSFEWSDLGAWDAIWTASVKDPDGNSAARGAVLIETQNSLVRSHPSMSVAVLGAKNLAVIVEQNAVLVCDLGHSQSVKTAKARFDPLTAVAGAADRPTTIRTALAEHSERFQTWLFTNALPLWWAVGADHEQGGFHEEISLRGRPTAVARRARVQARQAHVFAQAGVMGWTGPWRAAAAHAWDGFDDRYRRVDGLYRTLTHADGSALDDTPWLYDQAFALLAMASLYAAMPGRDELERSAERLLGAITSQMAHTSGFREAGEHGFVSNPHMHLLEAALAWIEAGGDERWRRLAQQIVDLALEAFIDPTLGAMREFFDTDWRALKQAEGQAVEPGHQFEWAWLLDRWAIIASDERARLAAQRLAIVGGAGFDPSRAVVIDAMDDELRAIHTTARLWPQTERLKAAARFALASSDDQQDDWLEVATSAATGLWRYLDVTPSGLWRDKQTVDGQFVIAAAPASSLYHIVGAVSALASLEPLLSSQQV